MNLYEQMMKESRKFSKKKVVKESRADLKEDFSSSFPDWIVNKLKGGRYSSLRNFLLKNNVDLNKAKFVEAEPPKSNRDPILKDLDRIPIFLLNDGTVFTPRSAGTKDQYVRYPSSNGTWTGRYIKNMPWKDILSITDKFGYIEVKPANFSTELKNQRKKSQAGVYDRRPNAQYSRPVYGDKKDKWGITSSKDDNIVGVNWLTKPGYDKSGYPLDPDKYVKKLNELNLDNFAQKLRRYYTSIKSTQSALAKAVTSADIDNTRYRGHTSFGRNVMSDIKDAADSLERAIQEYRELQKTVNFITNDSDLSDEDKNRYFKNSWGPSGKRLYDYLKDADAAITAINTNDSYQD